MLGLLTYYDQNKLWYGRDDDVVNDTRVVVTIIGRDSKKGVGQCKRL